MTVNRIGYPETIECPECGCEVEGTEDVYGVVYRCEQHDCASIFDGDELFPQPDDWQPPPPVFAVRQLPNDPR